MQAEYVNPEFDSSAPALFADNHPAVGGAMVLPPDEERHVRALRMRQGERLILLDGRGRRTEAHIGRIERRLIEIVADRTVLDGAEGRPYIVLAIGTLSDKIRFEWVVEKAVELGVREIVPLSTRRSEGHVHHERMQRIAIAALKQSQRSFLPRISEAVPFASIVATMATFDRTVICHEAAPPDRRMQAAVAGLPGSARLLVLIGPEGGFTEAEVADAVGAGACMASLGSARLRAETAALVALAHAAEHFESVRLSAIAL